ncbi:MAG: glycosyltransferase family 4 protein [Solirubrobacterales bacterium]
MGGAERWYRSLAERLADHHEVTYLTRRQWGEEGPGTPFRTVAVAPGGDLYTRSGRRRIWPPIRFGIGVFIHLLRHRSDYDAVHSNSFPYFSVLAAAAARRLSRSRTMLVVDWFEVWSREYWLSYAGPVAGRIGFAVQRLCARLPDQSFVYSRLAEAELRELGHGGPIGRLTGIYEGEPASDPDVGGRPGPPLVVAAGRHIPEKRLDALPAAIDVARRKLPDLRCMILGAGPQTDAIRARVREQGMEDAIELPGRVEHMRVVEAIAAASCLVHPSAREGYGLVVIEASSQGTPTIVVRGPENAATELIEEGVNGFVAESAEPEALAEAIGKAVAGGAELRSSTLDWYERRSHELSIESSLAQVEAAYEANHG